MIVAVAKTIAELTSPVKTARSARQLIEELMRQIMKYDDEFRREDVAGDSGLIHVIRRL